MAEMKFDKQYSKSGAKLKYPWDEMWIGEPRFFEGVGGSQSRPALAARAWGKRNGVKFSCREVDFGVEITRIA